MFYFRNERKIYVMKKKLIGALATVLVVGMLGGCGSEDTTVLKDMEVDKYVTLGEYKGLPVTTVATEVTEEDVNAWVDELYFSSISAEAGGVTDRAVEVGDTVSIDYVGTKDGVAFDGGTATGQMLTIGSGRFIDGFEDGLIGVKPGETVDLNLTFPEDYFSTDLAGAKVVFNVTVNFIMPAEKQDEVVEAMGMEDVHTVEELYEFGEYYLNAYAEQTYLSNVQYEIINTFMQGCTFEEFPKALVEKYAEMTRENIELTAANAGTDADSYTNAYYGMSVDDYVATYAERVTEQYVAFQAVANKENLNITDEELDTTLLETAQQYGFTTIEEFIGETPKEQYREYLMYDKVLQFLVENVATAE